jgi:hypothetical protein
MSRFEFFLRVFVLLLAASGWGAFAASLSRLRDTQDELVAVTEAYTVTAGQNEELGANFLKFQRAHESLQRSQDLKLKDLEQKVNTYELRLRQMGLIQE